MLARVWIVVGALNGLCAVALAAVQTHAGLPALGAGVQIQGWHAAALLFCGLRSGRWTSMAAAAFCLGTLLFCLGVYSATFFDVHLGPTAPTGGVFLMAGWLLLALSAADR